MRVEEFPALHKSLVFSEGKLTELRGRIRAEVEGPHDEICVFAVGSYGRGEAQSEVSDFEWMTVFDDARVAASEAAVFQAGLTSFFAKVFGRENLSINKTFGEVASFTELTTNVGGEADTNRALTYRMLALCEGQQLNASSAYKKIVRRLAVTYGSSHTAGHRLLSLATEIARYWRTLRIDYKNKVDERRKPWAVRALKLRSARRLAYFSSALDLVAFGPRIDYETDKTFDISKIEEFMTRMAGTPAVRLLDAAAHVRADEGVTKSLLAAYDRTHAALGEKTVRDALDKIDGTKRMDDETFKAIRAGCKEIHERAAHLVRKLPDNYQQQMLEMFLL